MGPGEIKFFGTLLAIIVGCLLAWKAATEIWNAAGIWVIIVPAAIAALAFYIWQRTTRRSEHPWS
jgi:hypothetical protein